MFKALFYPRKVKLYTENVRASITFSMSVLDKPRQVKGHSVKALRGFSDMLTMATNTPSRLCTYLLPPPPTLPQPPLPARLHHPDTNCLPDPFRSCPRRCPRHSERPGARRAAHHDHDGRKEGQGGILSLLYQSVRT